MTNKLLELGDELDRESAEWLQETHPLIFDALEVGVIRGATPEEIRIMVLRRVGTDRLALATRCEAASRFLISKANRKE